jgi:hypothetical protein
MLTPDISQQYTNDFGFLAGGGGGGDGSGIPVPVQHIRDFALFSVCSIENYSSAK